MGTRTTSLNPLETTEGESHIPRFHSNPFRTCPDTRFLHILLITCEAALTGDVAPFLEQKRFQRTNDSIL